MSGTLRAARERIRSYPVSRWIIWAGAGISLDKPTRLPLAFPLTDYAVGEMCGEGVREKLVSLWARANEICSTPGLMAPFSDRPRLESVLGGFADLERDAVRPDLAFLPGLASFAKAPPNRGHFAVASLVLQGARVFTSNFDLGIQAAVRELAASADLFATEVTGSIHRFRLKTGNGAGEIVHFHGVASDAASLGATLSRVKQGFPDPFPLLDNRLEEGVLVLMVGYSAGDSFDVNPYFASRAPGTWPASTLLFVQHPGGAPPAHLPALARGFGGHAVTIEHTGDLLCELAGGAREVPPEPAFDWRADFRSKLAPGPAEGQKWLRTCALASALGVNVDVVDPEAYSNAEAVNPGFDPARYHGLLAIVGRDRGFPAKELEHHRRGGGAGEEMLGYEYARGNLRKARAWAMSTDQILDAAGTVGELPWAPYTSMSTHGRLLLTPYLTAPWKRPRRPDEFDAIHRLSEVVDTLGSRPLQGVQFIRQVATARRFRLLLDALHFGEAHPALEQDILELYASLADLAGFVGSYRDFATARLLRVRYVPPSQRREVLGEAWDFGERGAALAALIGDPSGRRRASRLRAYCRAVRLFWSLPLPPRSPVRPAS
jgi:hypothetical protein